MTDVPTPPRAETIHRDQEVLAFIRSFVRENQYPPSKRMVADHFGWKSPTSAGRAIDRLVEAGAIERAPVGNRAIRIVRANTKAITEEM